MKNKITTVLIVVLIALSAFSQVQNSKQRKKIKSLNHKITMLWLCESSRANIEAEILSLIVDGYKVPHKLSVEYNNSVELCKQLSDESIFNLQDPDKKKE